jgi:hypothetical protein
MTRNIIRSSKQNPCPVCGRAKDGDCSQYADGQTVMCHTHPDGTGHDESQWHYTKTTDDGMWGVFVLKTERVESEFKKAPRRQGEKHYFYPDRTGGDLVRVTRCDDGAGNKTFFQSHWDGSKWLKGCPKEIRPNIPIYRYWEISQAIERKELIFIVEGEGVADRLWELGIPATTTIGGSGGYSNYGVYRQDLEGAKLVLTPDRDRLGVEYIGNFDRDFPSQIEGYYLAGTEGLWCKPAGGMDIGDDITDHKYSKEQILDRIISTDKYRELTTTPEVAKPPKEKRVTSGDTLLEIGKTATYFHTPDKVAYADVSINGNRHTYGVNSKSFRLWLSGEFFKKTERGASSQDLKDALCTFEARAIHDGQTREVYLRTAEHEQKIYIDLGTDDWRAIEADANGWNIVINPPVRFRRPNSLLPLPIPVEGGNLSELKDLLKIEGNDWSLLVTFLLNCYRPSLAYPVLVINAVRGSGKTTTAEIVKSLTDPASAGLIKLIGEARGLAVAANSRHLIVYDNVSNISADESDNLCMLATGMGFSHRKLQTDDEETIFQLTRPQIVTAIDAIVTRGDLASRSLIVTLPEISDSQRITKATLTAKLNEAKPRIFGALMTALSQTLAKLPELEEQEAQLDLKRMADFTLFGLAAERALGLEKGDFIKAYTQSHERGTEVTIESSPLGEAILAMVEKKMKGHTGGWSVERGESRADLWKGTASELLAALASYTDNSIYHSRFFPKAANQLSRQLNRLAPDLRSMGIEIAVKNNHGVKQLTLFKVVKTSPPSPPDGMKTPPSNKNKGGDVGGDGGDVGGDGGDVGGDGGDTNNPIATHKNQTSKEFQSIGGDGGDVFSTCAGSDLFKVGDRVRYLGENWRESLGGRTGIVTDFNQSGNRYQIDWGEDWAGCCWFSESELEIIP